ncbi:MAG: rhomboid family intramembrane serine protease [Syntrophomonadaceae bacterium]|jgi:membrane associated rhomboid family serine protease|nr:rhomboid family intramembrane serine protease [Syntrophomonadaceae bacterium]MDH7497597.1 rhomboid family intramembrane serine protease [Syntrophomonadaceae bacterium]
MVFPLHDNIPGERFPLVMWLLIVVNVAVFMFEQTLSHSQLEQFFYAWGLVPAQASLTTVFTSMFLHGGWAHLIGNMWALFLFGNNVEDRMGPLRFLAFYLACGAVAAMAHIFTNPFSSLPTVGASGALAGVMGAYVVLFPGARVLTAVWLGLVFLVEVPAVVYLGAWALIQLLLGYLSLFTPEAGGIAFWAHVGGFAAGMVLYRLFLDSRLHGPDSAEF